MADTLRTTRAPRSTPDPRSIRLGMTLDPLLAKTAGTLAQSPNRIVRVAIFEWHRNHSTKEQRLASLLAANAKGIK